MEENSPSPEHKKIWFNKKFSKVFLALVILVLAGIAIYFYMQYQNSNSLLKNPKQASTEEARQLVDQVGKLIELPINENPTIATVSDVTKLADQPFFSKALNGDKVLVYTQSKMLILFRPSLNKIISVGSVNAAPNVVASPTSAPAAIFTPTITPSASVTKTPLSPTAAQ